MSTQKTTYTPFEPVVNSLTTIGEKSFHLICKYLCDDYERIHIKSLSTLMSTCRYCYFAVHNLPNIRRTEYYFTNQTQGKLCNSVITSSTLSPWDREKWITKILPSAVFWRNAFSMLSLYIGKESIENSIEYIERIHETTGEAKFKDIDIQLYPLYEDEDINAAYKLLELGCEKLHIYLPCDYRKINLHRLVNVYGLSLPFVTSLTDVSMLGNVTSLDISHTQVSDVSMLGNAKWLNISHTRVSDVSMLGNVITLNISDTPVCDVSMLGKVYMLNLSNCKNITDFSKLGYVSELILWGTNFKESDLKYLTNNVYLDLQGLPITDLTLLGYARLHTLNILYCDITKYNIEDLRKLYEIILTYGSEYSNEKILKELNHSNVLTYHSRLTHQEPFSF